MYIKTWKYELHSRIASKAESLDVSRFDFWKEVTPTHHNYNLRLFRLTVVASKPRRKGEDKRGTKTANNERAAGNGECTGSIAPSNGQRESDFAANNGITDRGYQERRSASGVGAGYAIEWHGRESCTLRPIGRRGNELSHHTPGLGKPAQVNCVAYPTRPKSRVCYVDSAAETMV